MQNILITIFQTPFYCIIAFLTTFYYLPIFNLIKLLSWSWISELSVITKHLFLQIYFLFQLLIRFLHCSQNFLISFLFSLPNFCLKMSIEYRKYLSDLYFFICPHPCISPPTQNSIGLIVTLGQFSKQGN